jgi:hypothetical protein
MSVCIYSVCAFLCVGSGLSADRSSIPGVLLEKRSRRNKRSVEPLIIIIELHGLSPRANYTDLATAACRRSDCQILRIEGATWSA